MKNRVTLLGLGLMSVFAPLSAHADGVEKVTVTAQRREQTLQSVPLAVSVFRPKQLDTLAITNTLELSKQVPNLFSMNNTGLGSANAYYLRGLGNTETVATFDPPVGTYIDDVYITRQNGNNFAFFDLDRIEVLRGPQGTLFGRNTTGGAINMILRAPGDEFAIKASAGFGEFDKWTGQATVDLPIRSDLRTKFSVYGTTRDGYADNVRNGTKVNDDQSWGVRGAFDADLAKSVSWRGSVAVMADQGVNLLTSPCNPSAPTQCGGHYSATGLTNPLSTLSGQFNTTVPVSGRKAGFGLGNNTMSTLLTSNLRWDIDDDTTVNFITGYVGLVQKYALDFFDGRQGAPGFTFAGAVPVPTFTAAQINPLLATAGNNQNGSFVIVNDGNHKQFTQEVKVVGKLLDDQLEYVGGFFYLDERNKTDFADIFGTSAVPSSLLADRNLSNDTSSWALYLQADWHILPSLTATVGARYTDETKDFAFFDNRPACAANQATAGCISSINISTQTFTSGATIPLSQDTKMTTPRFALSWQAADNVMVFASATNGFKSGGWNARESSVARLLPFSPEKVWSYEAGVRSDLFDGKMRLNATYFHMDTTDLQTLSAFQNPSGSISFITRNFADLKNDGLEVEAYAVPVDGLTLFANLGLQDARYVINRNAPTFDKYGVISVNAQQLNCQAALAGLAAVGIVDVRTAAVRAQSYCGTGIVNPQGNISDPVRTPDVTLSAGVSYQFDLGEHGKLQPAVAANYIADSEVGTANVTIYEKGGTYNLTDGNAIWGSHADAVTLFTASLGWESPNGKWRGSLQCTNCTDESYVQSTLSNFRYFNQPRMWSVTLSAQY